MSYNTELQSNNNELQDILDAVNELPNATDAASVLYTEQSLTDPQKQQARKNIGLENAPKDIQDLQDSLKDVGDTFNSLYGEDFSEEGEQLSIREIAEDVISEQDFATTGELEVIGNIAKGANQAVSFGNYSTMITALKALSNDTYNVGQNIFIVTINVPDLWVSKIETDYSEYIYIDDISFTDLLRQNGKVQVGYYVLSQLETQKVDLTGYVKDDDIGSVVESALATAKESGEFDGDDGTSVTVSSVTESTESGAINTVKFSDGKAVHIKNGIDGGDGVGIVDIVLLDADDQDPNKSPESYISTYKIILSNGDNKYFYIYHGIDGVSVTDAKIEDGDLYLLFDDHPNYKKIGRVAGADGKTPVKGTDYFTEADKTEMVNKVKSALTSETWTFKLKDGSTVTKKVVIA